ncbi:DNA/RNA non-specific endonuclease [Nonomuraea sp. NPDC049309]|uniref:DNA/RNA non-specific endonuclease n=1 Tax=Nonomuraea sp. NPDC049309 TaxID=3364350 RepID=UPI003721B212
MPPTRLRRALGGAGATALLLTAAASAPALAPAPAPAKPDAVPCARLLRPSATYRAYDHTFTTDAAGRPVEAVARILVDRDAPRGSCEGAVGDWGGRGDWQGGHLIAASFRGVSMRYNLVPMRGRQINQGLMKRVENGARDCLEDGGEVRDYRVRLHYPNGTTLTPDTIRVSLKVASRLVTVILPNRTLSAKELRSRQDGLTAAFAAAPCGRDGA